MSLKWSTCGVEIAAEWINSKQWSGESFFQWKMIERQIISLFHIPPQTCDSCTGNLSLRWNTTKYLKKISWEIISPFMCYFCTKLPLYASLLQFIYSLHVGDLQYCISPFSGLQLLHGYRCNCHSSTHHRKPKGYCKAIIWSKEGKSRTNKR